MTFWSVMVLSPLFKSFRLDDAAVGVDDLAVDPATGTCQQGDGLGDVRGFTKALQRGHVLHGVDDLVRLAVEEKRCGGGPGGDRVDRDVAAAQLAGQDQR